MAKWEQLIIARERKHFSQAEAAERVNVGLVTYQRWEAGRSRPQPHHMRSLSRVFRELFEGEEETSFQPEVSSEHVTSHSPLPPGKSSTPAKHASKADKELDEVQAFIASHMTTHLLSLAFSPHSNCTDKRRAIRRSIKEFDTMNTDNQNYPITRREALSTLATLPLITLGLTIPGKSLPTTQYGAAIAHCAASLEACWDLRKRDDASDRLLAYQCATQYIPLLTTIAHHASQHRQEALDLATRYTLIKAFVARHLTSLPEAIQLGVNAVALSKETGDILISLPETTPSRSQRRYKQKHFCGKQRKFLMPNHSIRKF
jgi:transcriptional regulator with XRE-family HTH domain